VPDNESNVLLVINGMMRSGTIWFTRLLADSLNVASRTLYHDPPHTDTKLDSAIWHTERPGKFIRRLHYFTWEYPYTNAVPQVIICRDPRDTLVSQADYYTKGDVASRLPWFLHHWPAFYKGWSQDERAKSLVRYEDLLNDSISEIVRTLTELNIPVSEPRVMQATIDHAFSLPATQTSNFQKGNYGKSGSWQHRLTAEIEENVWSKCGEVAEMLGYSR